MTYEDGWHHFLVDTQTGLLAQEIDIPSFAWKVSVNDSAFTTTRAGEFGVDELSGVELPWPQIPGTSPTAKASAIMPLKRGLVSFRHCAADDVNSPGRPIFGGAIGVRTSTRNDVSFPLLSLLDLLDSRFLVHEKAFGTSSGYTTKTEYMFEGLSYRAIACAIIRECTASKPGGGLPIDLPYLDERGSYHAPAVSGDDPDSMERSTEKKTSKRTVADGWIETVTEGTKTTVTDHREKVTTRVITVAETYQVTVYKMVNGKRTAVKENRTRDKQKTITTGKTVTETKTVTEEKTYVYEKTVTKTVTTYTYDSNGKQTGSTRTTEGPTVTTTQKNVKRSYRDFNVQNHSCKALLDAIAKSDNGPDMQFRPYLTDDGQHVRYRFLAGSDADIHLHQDKVLALASYADGGSLQDMQVDRAAPIHRVYGVGAGQGSGTLCYLKEDLSLVNRADGWPLMESTIADSQADDIGTLKSMTNAKLIANRLPLMQIKGYIDVDDLDASGLPVHPLGSFWPGEVFDLHVTDFPDLPDGVYPVRLMEMSGDQTSVVHLTFDIMTDPVY